MSKKTTNGILGPKALEMVMRDVLGGMEEFAIMKSYEATGEEYKIIAIRPQAHWCGNDALYDFSDESEVPEISEPKKLAEVIVLDEYLRKVKREKKN